MTPFVSLHVTLSAVVDASGNCTLTIFGPSLDRVWLGSLTISGSPAGTNWDITIGAPIGSLLAPGPGGIYQILTGLNLVATASGLTVGNTVTAVLAGADFAREYAPPYFGPTSVTSVNAGTTGVTLPNTPTPHNFSYLGTLVAGTTPATDIPGFFVHTPPGSQSYLSRLWGKVLGGTSVDVTVRVNGVAVAGWNPITITATAGGFVLPTALHVLDLDYVDIVLSNLVATPVGLACGVDEIVVPP